MSLFRSGVLSLLLVMLSALPLIAADPPLVEKYLLEGKLAQGERELTAHLEKHPGDDQARFGLGALQFLQSIERLAQSLHRYGAIASTTNVGRQLPLLRLPVPENPRPEKVRYADVRKMLEALVVDLAQAEATLAKVKDEQVKLPLHFGQLRLDLDGNGRAEDHELAWKIYAEINRAAQLGQNVTADNAAAFLITFDYGDVHWLRGYCHLLSAMCETMLAYDQQALFDTVAHQIFAAPDVPKLPQELLGGPDRMISDIADAIAALHLMRFPVQDAKRSEAAWEHLQAVVDLSRKSWQAIRAETDDDHEWIPNPRQATVMPGGRVTEEMLEGWHDFLGEAEAILAGKKLVPHWRIKAPYGVNVRKVFLEPREFDLVLWVHGAAAVPYAEEGECTSPDTWQRFQTVFRGQFFGFAIWFN